MDGFAHWPADLLIALLSLYAFLSAATAWVFVARKSSDLKQKILAWWWFLPAVTLSLAFKASAGWVLAIAVLSFGLHELSKHMRRHQTRAPVLHWGLGALLCAVLVCVVWYSPWVGIGVILLDLCLIWTLFHRAPARAHILLAALVLLAGGMAYLPKIQAMHAGDGKWVLWICAVTALTDVGQYIAGTLWGKKKMSPKASPGKTWAGWLGGLCVAIFASCVLGAMMHLSTWPMRVALGVAIAVSGYLGDVTLSACKRMLAIKDFSAAIPGHGGLLDRVDSLTLTLPTLFLGLSFQSALMS